LPLRSCLYDASNSRYRSSKFSHCNKWLEDFTQWWLLSNEERCAWKALVYIVFGYAGGEGEGGRGGVGSGAEGKLRFARIWGQILTAHNSGTVRATAPNMVR